MDSTVKQTLGVDPSQVYKDYQQALQVKKAANGETGWWQKVTGIGGAMTAGAVAATTGLESLATASLNEGNGGGSLIGSLAKMQPSRTQQGQNGASSRFPANDLTGDRTVSDLIRKSRNPYQ